MLGPLIISLAAKTLLEKEKQLLRSPKVGGLVLFSENYDENAEDPKALLKEFISQIRSIHPDIVIMIDHEGGALWRFKKGFTPLPSAHTYGALYNQNKEAACAQAYQDAFIMAKELVECGIDMSLAPVVDLDGPSSIIGKYLRAYHEDPLSIVDIAASFIQGMNAAGMPATLKHFPGHGSCALDSHLTLPTDERDIDALQKDLLPFKLLIQKNIVSAVMSNFVLYPFVDPHHVAAFSSRWLKNCLREDLGFTGVVMSDCLDMKGADIGKNIARLCAAQKAGNDFLMYTHQHEEKLDDLLSILEHIPDEPAAALRREALLCVVQKIRKGGVWKDLIAEQTV